MSIEYHHRWFSPILNTEVNVLSFGEKGLPVIVFPTSKGRYYEAKDQGLIGAAASFLDQGLVKIYCVDSMDAMSWYNKGTHPSERLRAHKSYDLMVSEELIPFCRSESNITRIAVAGCSFGAFHATNFAFRHPRVVKYVISMGGLFDAKFLLDGYYDDNVYYNSPLDFLPDAHSPFFRDMFVFLGTGRHDMYWDANEKFAAILRQKEIPHWLDVRGDSGHGRAAWTEMFPHYISLLNSPQLF